MSFIQKFHTIAVDDRQSGAPVRIFYREAGPDDAPVVLLLHGFPGSSHQYRGLISGLSDKYHVIAPDLPGFGFSEAPDRLSFAYTFDHLAQVIEGFIDVLGLKRYALYVCGHGAPIGFRLAVAGPDRISAIISQNGNAYAEGLSEGWNPVRAYWEDPSEMNRNNLRSLLQEGTTRFRYEHGAPDISLIAPESIVLDQYFLDLPGYDEIQLDLLADYKSNITAYPHFHEYFFAHRPPMLAVWGKNDPFFLPAGAEAFSLDNPSAEVRFIDAGHFPLETNLEEIVTIIRAFLARNIDTAQGVKLFRLLDKYSTPAAARLHLDAMHEAFGFVPNLGYAIAAEPAALDAYLYVLKSLAATSLEPVEQQVAMVAASRANAAEYGIAVHSTLAERLGASVETVEALRCGKPLSDPRLEAIRSFAAAIATGLTQVSDHDVITLKAAGYDRAAMVAIALAASAQTLMNTVAHLARPEIDAAFIHST
jgi:AhpD family alkylhydroperoxidase